jgi:hypothetical protein
MPYASAGVRELWFADGRDIRGARAAAAGALHVTATGDTQH